MRKYSIADKKKLAIPNQIHAAQLRPVHSMAGHRGVGADECTSPRPGL
jgi:hypothetical protein